jgi:osmotically-inducible protein OsmY
MAAAKLTSDLNAVIARSSRLPSASGIDVSIDQGIVVLRGAVASDKERRVLEAIVRMSPGVREIRNEVRVGR